MLLIVPTLNAGFKWPTFINAVLNQKIQEPLSVCIIDSESTDDTVILSQRSNWHVINQSKINFTHGGARQKAIDMFAKSEQFVILMTQDAFCENNESFSTLLKPFKDPSVALVYGRQIPNPNASLLEKHSRLFNYPEISQHKSYSNRFELGIKTIFCSNSFAAYRLSALYEVGGFPNHSIFGEDMIVAAKLLKKGYSIYYESQACVIHSHNYSISDEFKRYFDIGVLHFQERKILNEFGNVKGEGFKLLQSQLKLTSELNFLKKILLIIKILFHASIKFIAFQLGKNHRWLPLRIKFHLSMFKPYWIKKQ